MLSGHTNQKLPRVAAAFSAYAVTAACWSVLSFGLVASLDLNRPFAAALLRDDAIAELGVLAFNNAPTEKVGDEARDVSLSKTALRTAPMGIEPLRQLGRFEQSVNGPEAALPLFKEAYRRSFRTPEAAAQLLEAAVKGGRFADAVNYADALLRIQPDLLPTLSPLLAAIGDHSDAAGGLAAALKNAPPWREGFLRFYGEAPQSEEGFLRLYFALRDTPGRLTKPEVIHFLYALAGRDRIDQALSLWLATLPDDTLAALPQLYNGDFRYEINDSPFNWNVTQQTGLSIGIVKAPGRAGSNALNLRFVGQPIVFPSVSQRLTLVAGHYIFSGAYKFESFNSTQDLIWRVYCAGPGAKLIAQSRPLEPVTRDWREFSAAFDIPSDGCKSQLVRLESGEQGQLRAPISGGIWLAGISISKR